MIPAILFGMLGLAVIGGIVAILVYVIAKRVEDKKKEKFEDRTW